VEPAADGLVVSLNGVELFVRRLGDRSLPVLIVIHGGPTWDHSYLLPAVAELADVAHVVMFDLRGCGRSSRTPPVGRLPTSALQPDYLAGDVAALAGWLGAGQVDVLGFSYGGGIAMRVADQHPRLVRRLILASATATRDFAGELEASPDYRERRALCAPVNVDELAGPDAADGALSRAMAYADAPVSIWRLDRLADWHAVLAQVRFSSDWNEPYATGTLRPAAPDDPAGVLRQWGGPLLIVHGQRELGFPIGVARWLHGLVPGSTLAEIPDAAHMAHFDNQSAWLAAIRAFLAGAPPA
jgi:pimeloyl-ACP methyl ester carboxylesterase